MDELYRLSQTQLDHFRRPYKRSFLREHHFNRKLTIILGQRGVGKTTAMVQYLLETIADDVLNPGILYIQSDHFLVQGHSLYGIAEQFSNLGGKTVCFDEIHKYPRWSMELKSIVDTFPGLNVLASGSSALEIASGSHDLSRRALQLHMPGLSFREYLELSQGLSLDSCALQTLVEHHPRLTRGIMECLGERKILPLFKAYLRHGWYPFFFEEPHEAVFHQLLNQNVLTTLESDLISVHPSLTGNSIGKIRRLLAVLAASVPFVPDLKHLAQLTDTGDQRTLKTYLKYLEDCGLLRSLSRTGKGLRSLEKPEKIYLNNTSLSHAIVPRADVGNVRETFLLSMLMHRHQVSAPLHGDFCVDNEILIEVGGRNKDFSQIKMAQRAFLALDDIETGFGSKIPLWLFGFLY